MRRVLIANRGEIAVRIARACFDEQLECVAAVSQVDRDSLAADLADRAVTIGPAAAGESYLSVDRILAAAKLSGCDAIHPGYGFLSERPELAAACEDQDVVFVGPPAEVMRRSGDKMRAREIARTLGIPTGVGSDGLATVEEALAAAERAGYPLMLKASAGGGGRGMAIMDGPDDLRARFPAARAEAQQAFGDGRLYVERYVRQARHVEVQVMADTHGGVVHLGERDCSCQRRYQKLLEEAPAREIDASLIARIREAAVTLARELGYVGAGTIEFLVDVERREFVFLEVNARVQVEHPVTEMLTGVDIVREQLRIASGEPLSFTQRDVAFDGHVIECRINAEDPRRDFTPSPGTLARWVSPQGHGVRVDTHCRAGATVTPHYDSLLAKLIVHDSDRERTLALAARALERFRIDGVATSLPLLADLIADERFRAGPVTTRWLEEDFMPRWNLEDAR